jgi:hypothetical protein
MVHAITFLRTSPLVELNWDIPKRNEFDPTLFEPVIKLAGLSASRAQHFTVLSGPDHRHKKHADLARFETTGGVRADELY